MNKPTLKQAFESTLDEWITYLSDPAIRGSLNPIESDEDEFRIIEQVTSCDALDNLVRIGLKEPSLLDEIYSRIGNNQEERQALDLIRSYGMDEVYDRIKLRTRDKK